jgi:integrase/recombinase XerD
MAKKKTTKTAKPKLAEGRAPAKKQPKTKKAAAAKKKPAKPTAKRTQTQAKPKKRAGPKVSKPKATKKNKSTNQKEVIDMSQLVQQQPSLSTVMDSPDSLLHWFTVYLKTMVDPDSNTFKAKRDDIQRFLGFFHGKAKSFDCDKWTPSITQAYVRWLPKQKAKNPRGGETDRNLAPSTCARNLDTLRHAARWIHRQREFLTGIPFKKRDKIEVQEPGWQGLTDTNVVRLRSAAEQLIAIQTRSSQRPRRNYAQLILGLHTGLRVEEINGLDLSHYQGKHLKNVHRTKSSKFQDFFLDTNVREVLNDYIEAERGREPGPLFTSKTGGRLDQSNVYRALQGIAKQANTTLPDEEKIKIHPHLLRHTFLKRVATKEDIRAAREVSGLNSDKYLWRYVKVTEEEVERAVTGLYD